MSPTPRPKAVHSPNRSLSGVQPPRPKRLNSHRLRPPRGLPMTGLQSLLRIRNQTHPQNPASVPTPPQTPKTASSGLWAAASGTEVRMERI
jgi:hypothetical protein